MDNKLGDPRLPRTMVVFSPLSPLISRENLNVPFFSLLPIKIEIKGKDRGREIKVYKMPWLSIEKKHGRLYINACNTPAFRHLKTEKGLLNKYNTSAFNHA